MAEIINLRSVRKRAKREQEDRAAATNRLAHGTAKHVRQAQAQKREKAEVDLDRHRIDRRDDR